MTLMREISEDVVKYSLPFTQRDTTNAALLFKMSMTAVIRGLGQFAQKKNSLTFVDMISVFQVGR